MAYPYCPSQLTAGVYNRGHSATRTETQVFDQLNRMSGPT